MYPPYLPSLADSLTQNRGNRALALEQMNVQEPGRGTKTALTTAAKWAIISTRGHQSRLISILGEWLRRYFHHVRDTNHTPSDNIQYSCPKHLPTTVAID